MSNPRSSAVASHHPCLHVDDLAAIERIGQIGLSPDGRNLVCSVSQSSMASNASKSSLWLLPTGGRAAPRRLTACGDKDGQAAWSPNGNHIAFLARRTQQAEIDKTAQIYLIAADGGEAVRKSNFAPGIESFKWMPDGRRIVFAAWVWPELKGAAAQSRRYGAFSERKESGYLTSEPFYRHWDHNLPMGRVLHLMLLELASGRVTDLFEGSAFELPRDASGNVAYDPSPDGQHIAFIHDPQQPPLPGNRLALAEVEIATRKVKSMVDDARWDIAAPRYRPDGLAIAVTAAETGHRHTALSSPALVGPGKGWRVIVDAAADIHVDSALRWSDNGASLLFTAQQRGRCHLWRCEVQSGEIGVAFEGGWVQDFDAVGLSIVTCSDSAQHPARVFALGNGSNRAPRRLERFNDKLLAGRRLGEVREVTLTGALGEPVQMWLTLPPGFDSRKKHPMLQVIHGGPFAAAGDSFSYRWNAHVLASRGHVVAQVNYHGSSGFGFAFRDSIMGRQGELELLDIEAASDWLLAQPWVDAKRLSAAGGSYGGFLVAWMNGHVAQGRYRCYVCHAGVFDRVATFSADSYMDRPRDLGARYWEDMPKVQAQSPHSSAGQMTTPTLVIHGALDYRVPDCNGLAYYNTLKARGIDARLLWFPDENHWVLKPCNSRLWYQEVLDWVISHDATPRSRRRSMRQ